MNIARMTTVLSLALLGFGFSIRAEDGKPQCKSVSGTIAATLTGETSVMGTVRGDLQGAVTANVVRATPQPDGRVSLDLTHVFLTDARDTLITEDQAVWTPVAGRKGVFQMSTTYSITGGSGKYEGASGTMENHGEVDLGRKQITLGYSGQVCPGK